MTTFRDFDYARPDMAALEGRFDELLESFVSAPSAAAQAEAMAGISELRDGFESMSVIAEIRHTADTADPFYDAENDFMDGAKPVLEGLKSRLGAALVASPFRPELGALWGGQIFRLAEAQLKTFKPEVLEDLQEENGLASEYVKLKAGARIPFEGGERNLSEMRAFAESPDRAVRKAACSVVSAFYGSKLAELDRIYGELVRLRDSIARALGFPDFTGLGYARMGRTDYGPAEAASFRTQILTEVVPAATRLRSRQASRLGIRDFRFHDEGFEFVSGNAAPIGGPAFIVERGRAMFEEMSAETGEFIRYMVDRSLLDLETRKGKAGGAYCAYIPSERSPFLFANFNGTSGDIDSLTHEAGHAFQCYRSRDLALPDYRWPTYEAAEIHSMSMELLASPWMEAFFGSAADKYRFSQLGNALLFLPYAVSVDEFQHWVYANPKADAAERRKAWRSIERAYIPSRDYGEDSFLESGGYWYRQTHIYQDPFYYIDYALAQVCAFEFWGKFRANRFSAWRDYAGLCDLGGSRSFTELVAAAGLRNPFLEGSVRSAVEPVSAWLDAVDDSSL